MTRYDPPAPPYLRGLHHFDEVPEAIAAHIMTMQERVGEMTRSKLLCVSGTAAPELLDRAAESAYPSPQQHPPRLSTMRTRRVSRLRGRKRGSDMASAKPTLMVERQIDLPNPPLGANRQVREARVAFPEIDTAATGFQAHWRDTNLWTLAK